MARVYMAYGEYAKAEPLAEQALVMAKRNQVSDSELATCLIDLATLYNYQEKLAEAEKMCKLGLKLQEKILYENHPYLAYTLRTLSSIYQSQGRYPQANLALEKAMAIMLDSHSADDKAMTPFLVDIAKLLVAQGKLEKAESYYQKAILLINSSYGPDHLYTANVLGDVAELYILQGRYVEAEKLINKTVALQKKFYGPEHRFIVSSWLRKAKVYQIKGNHTQAEKLITKALAVVKKTGNKAAYAKLERDVEGIRVSKQVAYARPSRITK